MNGVSRYDGYSFRKYYNNNDPNSISGNWAFAICEDAAQRIWIGTLDGLNVFDAKTGQFKAYQHAAGDSTSIFSNNITSLLFDTSGKLWIGTREGLTKLDPATGKFERFSEAPFRTYISSIIRSDGDHIWIATAMGVVRFNTRSGAHRFYEISVKPDPYGAYFWSLLEDQKDLYIATGSEGIIRLSYDPGTGDYGKQSYLDQHLHQTEVFDICKSPAGDFWLATDRGIAKIEHPGTTASKVSFYRNNPLNNQSLSNNTVYKVFIDRTDNLWCGTELGLNKLNLHILPFQYFTFKDPSAKDQVRSIFTPDGENIWIGTAKNACYQFNIRDNATKPFRFQPSAFNSHRSIYMDGRETWMGTLGGAMKVDRRGAATMVKEATGLAIFTILRDSRENTWLGTNDGLIQIRKDGSHLKYAHDPANPRSLSSSFVHSLHEDHNGFIWVGFETSGLSYLNPSTGVFTRVTPNKAGEKVFGNIIYSILEYPANVIWAGSESGLNRITLNSLNNGQYDYNVKNYFEQDGLADQSVNGILAGKDNSLWISTIKGLLHFDVRTEQFRHYLPTLNFSLGCAYRFDAHNLLFGAADGFLVFDPEKISHNDVLPEVAISELKLFNKEVGIGKAFNGDVILEQSITETKEISLGYRNNVFTLGFVGLHFSDPENNAYAYKMEGFDNDWIYTSAAERAVTYTNLDPGTYTFQVKAANSFGKWNEKPATLTIHIFPPWWKTWWAKLLYFIAFNIILVILIRYLVKQSRQRHEFETERLLRLKDEELHQEQLGFFTNITHELQTPLTLINGSIERFLYKKEQSTDRNYFLSMIHQQSSRLTYLVNQLLDFRKAEAGHLQRHDGHLDVSGLLTGIANLFVPLCEQKKLQYSILVEPGITGWMDKDKLEKIIFNLLSNAFKHSESEEEIIFSVYPAGADKALEITVANSGCRLSQEQLGKIFDKFFVVNAANDDKYSHGIGLAFTQQLVNLLGGRISATSENNWISFKVWLPLAEAGETETPQSQSPSYLLRSIASGPDAEVQRSAREHNKHALVAALEGQDKKSILVVEDEPAIRYLLRDILAENYIVYEAENGRLALELMKNTLPDLIISDIMMPEIDGLELCNKVKNSPDTCHIPFIHLSARGTLEQKTEGYDVGADAYIPKPFDTAHLLVRVRNLLEYRQRLLNLFKKDDLTNRIAEEELADGDKSFLNRIVQIIEENMDNTELDAAFLEEKLVVSKMQLYRKLKALSDMAPSEFIRHIRLQRAGVLLVSTQLTVSEIFYKTGFNNKSYFFKEFKKRYQCSPKEYRDQHRIHA
ncbi:hybrid sensor histidine kinase/response regulator [Chitinophaga cymbidii]|uniref:histidine kinase n=2 Tax=Chitinophaga cymbidii TaxID=1096750 RepID=A0A512RPB8_9BACT|nr:hybrid sensor histidine kinase/response regulator [Chitinophaga cymbidii]